MLIILWYIWFIQVFNWAILELLEYKPVKTCIWNIRLKN